MTKYRQDLPQLKGDLFLSDGGIETTLIFHQGLELPHFAAFILLTDEAGCERLRAYYMRYIAIALANRRGFIMDTATWRASFDWGAKLGFDRAGLAQVNRRSVELLAEMRGRFETRLTPMVISGAIGPRGDGYSPSSLMTAGEAESYHMDQVEAFRDSDADMVAGYTMTYAEEAMGIVRAARRAAMPVTVSFTLETDGRLPTGQELGDAVRQVDAETRGGPDYYMINCAHPTHFDRTLTAGDAWVGRIRGLRANASKRSHAELDGSTDLDAGNPAEFGSQYGDFLHRFPQLTVLGGCCGTDHRHLEAVAACCAGHGSDNTYAA